MTAHIRPIQPLPGINPVTFTFPPARGLLKWPCSTPPRQQQAEHLASHAVVLPQGHSLPNDTPTESWIQIARHLPELTPHFRG
ncbi:hypothetical protein ONZ45_g14114 [Pleurotus djamor]|nr:hypothetical protein ONZ45_g14114 [Pleurotus djamor]